MDLPPIHRAAQFADALPAEISLAIKAVPLDLRRMKTVVPLVTVSFLSALFSAATVPMVTLPISMDVLLVIA
jgi:hypothetical protein